MSQRLWMMSFVACGLLVVLAACVPSGGESALTTDQAPEAVNSSAQAQITSPAEATGLDAGTESLPTVPNVVVEVTALTDVELSEMPPGQTEPGVGDPVESEPTEPNTDQSPPSAGWSLYTDTALGFTVLAPDTFVIDPADPANLSHLIPTPNASIYFVDPSTADSAFAGADAPDLEVRVYESGPVSSLEMWLSSAGVITEGDGKTVAPFQTTWVSGLEVCESTMAFPPCSVFIAGNNRVFHLRSITQEGEAMAETFQLLSQ